MAKNLIDIEDIPPQLANKVKQDLRFKTGNFVWRVRFNIPLDPHTVNKDTMYVTNSQNQKLRSYIRYDTTETYGPMNGTELKASPTRFAMMSPRKSPSVPAMRSCVLMADSDFSIRDVNAKRREIR